MNDMHKLMEKAVAFHGHSCPGLALGVRVAAVVLESLGPHSSDEELVCVSETDMCAADAVQALCGCTFGKGNLIHRDYGKMAFSFWRRSDGRAMRIMARPAKESDPEVAKLKQKQQTLGLDKDEAASLQEKRMDRINSILDDPVENVLLIEALSSPPPSPARSMPSLTCDRCHESTMESRTRRFMGQVLCIPCFENLDRR